jgi:oligogalacturonide lyase
MNRIKAGRFATLILLLFAATALAQPRMATGGRKMPNEWIDSATGHVVIKLSRIEGKSNSFYFHNNPFIGNQMVFYNSGAAGRQIWTVDLNTLKTNQITSQPSPMNGEIVGRKTKQVYYQIKDSVFATNIETKKTSLLFVFPADFKSTVTTINADETMMAGRYSDGTKEKEILKEFPEKSQYFNRIFDARIPNTLFTINLKTGVLKKIHTDSTWLGHVQFSPTDPNLLMFCHEGPWHKVDRIWTINTASGEVKLMHKRSIDMEIAGHEWFAPDGKTIWYDLQTPRSVKFFVAGTDVGTGKEKKYEMQRDEWSIHFNCTDDQQYFAGDGGDPGQVAKAANGMWIYLFKPEGDHFHAEKLVDMHRHNYKLEPNVHFSPDGKWVIFRANFEGEEGVYGVKR